MSNNDGAAMAQYIAVGEELSRLMVQADYLREALAVIYHAYEKAMDEGETWFVTDDTTVGGYICSVLGAPPEDKE